MKVPAVACASLSLLSALALTGCTAGEATPPPATVTVTVTAPAPEPMTPSPTIELPAVESTLTPSPSPAAIVVTPGAERKLNLSDAYNPSNYWKEASFQQVGSTENQQAIGVEFDCYRTPMLEFRFAQNTGTFRAVVAQDLNSESSNETQEWALIVDGRPQETKQISFKDSVELTAPLTGVAVVKIAAKNQGNCGTSTGLITSATIQG